jgi:predicted nucleic acid-binding protein
MSSLALYPEARSAVASARRRRRIDEAEHVAAIAVLDALWGSVDGLELTEPLARRSGELAEAHGLRGYDAIHLASAEAILDDGDVMIVSDTRLAEAAASIGIDALVPAV